MKCNLMKKVLNLFVVFILIFSFSLSVFANEDSSYSQFTVSNGRGIVGKSSVAVTKGVTAKVDIKMKLKCVTQEDLVKFVEKNSNYFTTEQYSQITESSQFKNENYGAGLFAGILGLTYGKNSGSWDYFRSTSNQCVTVDNSEKSQLLKELHDLTQHDYELTGQFTIRGKSYIPTKATCLFEITKIKFQDGETLQVVNTSGGTVVGADGSSNTVDGSGSGQLIPVE